MTRDTAYRNAPVKLVETGLDLLDFPTMIFYETGYSLHTLRQASRRSWRIGQKHAVRVLFFFYEGTFQERCIQHMGRKQLVSLSMEGKFSGEGLNAMGDEDMMTSLARELVEKGGFGESADKIWRDLRDVRKQLFDEALPAVAPTVALPAPAASAVVLDAAFDEAIKAALVVEEVVAPIVLPPLPSTLQPSLYGLAAFANTPAKRKHAAAVICPDQMMLFLNSGGQGIPALYYLERHVYEM